MSERAAVNFPPFRDHLATRHPDLLFLFNVSPDSREKQETVAQCPIMSGIRFARRRELCTFHELGIGFCLPFWENGTFKWHIKYLQVWNYRRNACDKICYL